MNTHAKFRLILATTVVAAILAMQPQSSWAEDTTTPGTSPKSEYERAASAPPVYNTTTGAPTKSQAERAKKQKVEAEAAATAPAYDIVIANGVLVHGGKKDPEPPTLGAAIEVLRKCQPNANIVLGPGLSDLPVGEVKLHAYNVVEVLQALRAASGDKFDWTMPGSPEPNVPGQPAPAIDPSTGLPSAPGAAPAQDSGLFVLREPVRTEQDWRVVEAFNIARYLDKKRFEASARNVKADDGQKIDTEAVAQLEMLLNDTIASFRRPANGEAAHLKFEYHRGATLLIVIGPKMDVEVAHKVMSALMTEPTGVRSTENSEPFAGAREALSVVAIPLKNASLTTVYSAATSLLDDKRSKVVVADERTKTLIISATKEEVTAIKKAIEQLEQAPKPYVGDFPAKEGKSFESFVK